MFIKLLIALNLSVFALSSVIREPVSTEREDNQYPVNCSILNECGGNWECVEFLISLYRLDCFAGQVTKKSYGGGKRGGLKNLEKIFLGSYMTRMG